MGCTYWWVISAKNAFTTADLFCGDPGVVLMWSLVVNNSEPIKLIFCPLLSNTEHLNCLCYFTTASVFCFVCFPYYSLHTSFSEYQIHSKFNTPSKVSQWPSTVLWYFHISWRLQQYPLLHIFTEFPMWLVAGVVTCNKNWQKFVFLSCPTWGDTVSFIFYPKDHNKETCKLLYLWGSWK